jgi:hypothetical protein
VETALKVPILAIFCPCIAALAPPRTPPTAAPAIIGCAAAYALADFKIATAAAQNQWPVGSIKLMGLFLA